MVCEPKNFILNMAYFVFKLKLYLNQLVDLDIILFTSINIGIFEIISIVSSNEKTKTSYFLSETV
jgi:hypothetical protein